MTPDVPPADISSDSPAPGVEPPPTWRWLLADQAGVVVTQPDLVFESQQDAEDWLGEQFEELADDGIATVSLVDGEHVVYGPMYLAPDGAGPPAEAEI